MGEQYGGETAVYEAIARTLSPHYEVRSTDLRAAARAALEAFLAAANPPMALVGRDEQARLLSASASGAELSAAEHGRAMRAWVMRQLLAERTWLHERLAELPPGWTACVHRRQLIANEEWPDDGASASHHFEVAVHFLPPKYVCDCTPREQYTKVT